MPYNETDMEDCRLGYDNLHVIPTPPENIPPNYVLVSFTCPCGDFTTEFALHRYLLYHLMGRTGRMEISPEARPYLQMLSAFQAEAILTAQIRVVNEADSEDSEDDTEENVDR